MARFFYLHFSIENDLQLEGLGYVFSEAYINFRQGLILGGMLIYILYLVVLADMRPFYFRFHHLQLVNLTKNHCHKHTRTLIVWPNHLRTYTSDDAVKVPPDSLDTCVKRAWTSTSVWSSSSLYISKIRIYSSVSYNSFAAKCNTKYSLKWFISVTFFASALS